MARNIEMNIKPLIEDHPDEFTLDERDKQTRIEDDLSLEIQRSLDYCSSVLRQTPARKIVFLPENINDENFLDIIKSNIGLDSRMLKVDELFDSIQEYDELSQHQCILVVTTKHHNLNYQ